MTFLLFVLSSLGSGIHTHTKIRSSFASSAQPGGKRCFTPVGNEVVARAKAVVDEVEGLVVKYSIIHDEIVLRHTSVESREYGDVGGGDDDDTSGERNVIN
jgi:hypothetical protein